MNRINLPPLSPMRRFLTILALLTFAACSSTESADEDAALDLVVERYGPCYAAPGFPEADAETLRDAAVVRTVRASGDWVPVQVFLQAGDGRTNEATWRVNTVTGETTPQFNDADAAVVLAKCP